MYVLRRIEDGKYVAPAGQHHSYTRNLQNARLFGTRDAAEADKCGNEQIVTLSNPVEWQQPKGE